MCHLFLLSQASSGMLCHIDLSEFSGPVRKLARSHRRTAICRKARIYVCVCVFGSTSIFVIQSCLSLIELGHQKGHSDLTRARKVSASNPFTSSWGIKFVPLILFFFQTCFFFSNRVPISRIALFEPGVLLGIRALLIIGNTWCRLPHRRTSYGTDQRYRLLLFSFVATRWQHQRQNPNSSCSGIRKLSGQRSFFILYYYMKK